MATIKTIGPGGTYDFNTLQAWEDWADDQASADQWAQCCKGVDMGEVLIQGWTATPTVSLYPRIFTTIDCRHDSRDSAIGAYINVAAAATGIIVSAVPYVRIEGIRIEINGDNAKGIELTGTGGSDQDGLVVDSNLILANAQMSHGIFVAHTNTSATGDIRNNIIYGAGNGASGTGYGIKVQLTTTAGNPTSTIDISNNSVHHIRTTGAASYCYHWDENSVIGTATVNATVKNNIGTSSQTRDFDATGVLLGTISGSYNMSEDTSANDIGTEFLVDNDMEAVGVGDWTVGNNATLTKDVGAPHGGVRNLRVAYNGTTAPFARQDVCTIGLRYQITGWVKGDGVTAPSVRNSGTTLFNGTSVAAWQYFNVSFTATSDRIYLMCPVAAAGFSEFDDFTITNSIVEEAPADIYVNEASDWRLKADSAARVAGTTISDFTWDAQSVPASKRRPQDEAWDMGAMEREALSAYGGRTGLSMMGMGT